MEIPPESPPPDPALPVIAPDVVEQTNGMNIDDVVPTEGYAMLPMVGLGGSAGSIQALQSFFSTMPPDSGLIFVVILHLSPEHESVLAQLLSRVTTMNVVQATNGVKVEANNVYVIPPGKQLAAVDGHLRLADLEPRRGRHVAVDLFFRTLADSHGPHSAAIVLSGGDGDGAVGIKRIKERGGLTIAQDPDEAEFPGMPRSAVATGMVDWVLEVGAMPARLQAYFEAEKRLKLVPEESPEAPPFLPTQEEGEAALRDVLTFLRTRTGRDFSYYKRATTLRRISRRMQVNNVEDLPSYLNFLRTHTGEAGALLEDLLISVTNFFRDREAFAALEASIPALFKDKTAHDSVRVWVPACATGEEAYSIAMLLSEYARTLTAPPQLQIFATDLDDNVISFARNGLYPDAIIADVSEQRLDRFFVREHGGYRVRRELREIVLFALHDLLKDSPFSRIDLVSCRNLLIYLNRDAQGRAFEIFHFALRAEGQLFLGTSESIDEARQLFSVMDKKHHLYQQRATPRTHLPMPASSLTLSRQAQERSEHRPVIPAFAAVTGVPALPPSSTGREPAFERSASWSELHFQLIERFAPPSAMVNSEYEIIHLSESAGQFLQIQGGELSRNLLKLVHPMLRIELRAALFSASQTQAMASARQVIMETAGERRKVDIHVMPATEIATDFLLVVFEASHIPETAPAMDRQPDAALVQLEQELESVKNQLRNTLEQSESSREELKASNEELQAMNEELRSATEELETSREELQSINEELVTVNQELKGNVDQLSGSNSDLHNLMSATAIATIFLDRELQIMRYTPSAVELFSLISSDLGRSLSDLTRRLDYPEMEADARQVLENLTPSQREVSSAGRWFLARALPYRTTDDRIAGVVFTFLDITVRKQAIDALASSEERLRLIVENASEYAIFSTDLDRKVISWNSGAERLLGFSEAEILGKPADVIFTPEDQAVGACQMEAATAQREGRSIDERWHQRKDGSRFWGSGAMMPMRDGGHEVIGFVKIFRDQTRAREISIVLEQSQRDLLIALDKMKDAHRAKDEFIGALSHELRTPLNPVLLAARDLSGDERLPEDARAQLEMMERNIALEARLIDDLLDITSIAEGKLQLRSLLCDTHELIKLAIEVVESDARNKDITISCDLSANNRFVETDPARFQQVFWNLLRNAIKFTPRGGMISVTSSDQDHNHLRVEVADTGIGIESDMLEQIFLPFEQGTVKGDHRYGGVGLGLAIARAIVLAQGGSIRAQSPGPGKGTTLLVDVPNAVTAGPGKTASIVRNNNPKPNGRIPLRLLVVDDHESTLQILSKLLNREGHQVVTASTAGKALEAAGRNEFDLVISDLGLPDSSGFDLMAKLRDSYQLRGIALSGYGMDQDVARSQESGFVNHLTKPIDFAELRDLIAAAI